MKALTIEQMKLLADKGFSITDVIAFAEMGATKSKAAERTARWRAKKNGTVTENVTRDGHSDASPPPIEEFIPPVSSNDETTPPRKSKKAEPVPAKPDGVRDQTWAGFLEMRKRKRSPVTESALDGIETEAAKAGWTMEAALAKCNARGWQGFEAEWVANAKPPDAGNDDLASRILKRQAAESAA